jgi:hypothetical protein
MSEAIFPETGIAGQKWRYGSFAVTEYGVDKYHPEGSSSPVFLLHRLTVILQKMQSLDRLTVIWFPIGRHDWDEMNSLPGNYSNEAAVCFVGAEDSALRSRGEPSFT